MGLHKTKIDVSPNETEDIHEVYSDLDDGTMQAALENWIVRTNEYTIKSFILYVRSKGVHTILTKEEYQKRKQKKHG
jgi:hypothetical protein